MNLNIPFQIIDKRFKQKMNTILTKKTLNQSLKFIEELNLDNDDYEIVLDKFKAFFKKIEIEKIFSKFLEIDYINSNQNFEMIMKEIIKTENIPNLNILLQQIIKDENLIDEIQEIFLEKLL